MPLIHKVLAKVKKDKKLYCKLLIECWTKLKAPFDHWEDYTRVLCQERFEMLNESTLKIIKEAIEHKFFTLVHTKSMSRREQEQKSLNSHLQIGKKVICMI